MASRDDSYDARVRCADEIKIGCRGCGAGERERCVARRYASGRPMQYRRGFCPERAADARPVVTLAATV